MDCSKGLAVALMAVVVVASTMVGETRAQIPDCASKLVPCANYLNSTKPPESCCQPIRETIRTQRECLCNLYKNPSIFQTLGINITQALELPKHCGVSADVSACKTGTASSPTASLPPPPPTAGRENGNSGTSKMTWVGVSTLFFFWASIMAY